MTLRPTPEILPEIELLLEGVDVGIEDSEVPPAVRAIVPSRGAIMNALGTR